MIRKHFLAAIGFAAFGLASPLAAQDAAEADVIFLTEEEEELQTIEKEMTEAFSMFGALFKAEPLTGEQEALLPLASEMARRIMPEGSFGIAMRETLEPMMAMIATDPAEPRAHLAGISGVEMTDLERLSDDDVREALDIFDPHFAARNERTAKVMTGMIGRLLEAIEPAYREGMARALARRFSEAEMRELLDFFATPTGGKFAAQSFLVQYDPQLLGVMEAMGPAAVKLIPDMTREFTAIETELGTSRDFSELSAAERTRAARLIGKSVRELDALVPEVTTEGDAEDPVA
ncbi:MAG: DUF2059 domain-containing protein [Porphyrobacter sp.]|nr:DUF2059 domain-containing protein [Porphyrobacter sp.]